MQTNLESYLQVDTSTAAEILGVSKRKLEKMRIYGGGPRFVRMGRNCVRYRVKDLVTYQESLLRCSTAEDRVVGVSQ